MSRFSRVSWPPYTGIPISVYKHIITYGAIQDNNPDDTIVLSVHIVPGLKSIIRRVYHGHTLSWGEGTASYMTSGKLCELSRPPFPVKWERNNRFYLMVSLKV